MKLRQSFIIVGITCLFAGTVNAVSRVGGGKVRSQSSGFEMTLPGEYIRVESVGRDAVLARGPIFFHGTLGRVEAFIRISEFMDYFADAKNLSAVELEQRLSASEWTPHEMADACAVAFKSVSGQVISYIVTWGDGKGFVVNTTKLSGTDDSVQTMLQTLNIDPGSCAWK